MYHYALIALLSATPNIDRTTIAPPPTVTAVADDPGSESWLDQLIFYLELLCAILGPEYCPTESAQSADSFMNDFIDAYEQHGVSSGLPTPDALQGLGIIEDLYDHVVNAEEGSQTVIDDMLDTLESAYSDLGGNPANL